MNPVEFVKANWKQVAIGFAAFVVAAGLWRFVDRAHEWGIVPLAVGAAAFFLAKRFVK